MGKLRPEEVLFSPSADCNLNCRHCVTKRSAGVLSKKRAVSFLRGCKKLGIGRVGFTGGEPFLALDFLCALTKEAVKEGMLFDRIMTNGVWYRSRDGLRDSLARLRKAGYDGSICVSVDALHGQDLRKVACFIETALSIWNRPDLVSIACIKGVQDSATKKMLGRLFRALKSLRPKPFVKILEIELSPIGKAEKLKKPWGKIWFKEDFCKGPGNALFVLPDGSVKPCCGYATDSKMLTIGNIRRDSASAVMDKAKANRFVSAVFGLGLSAIRRRLERAGVRFPGKTDNHCYFCHYILTKIPRGLLAKCLD